MTMLRKNWSIQQITLPLVALLALGSEPIIAAQDSDAVLLNELRKRDAVIEQLLKRVDQLEKRQQDTVVWIDSQPSSAVVMHQIDDLQGRLETLAEAKGTTHEPVSGIGSGARKKQKKRGPGAVEVDEFAAERALERTLTNEGALLLPYGVYEISPFFSYSHRETVSPVTALVGTAGVVVGTSRKKRDAFNLGAGVRIGLPYESQLELTLPYRIAHEQTTIGTVGGTTSSGNTGNSIGDVSVGLAKTLFREDGWKPDLIGRFVWNTSTGDESDNGVSLGSGFDELSASLTALKRQDPLAFTASLGYTKTLEKNNSQPGDQYSLSLGTSIAASPSTSLSFTLSQVFAQEAKLNGKDIPGSEINSSEFLVGFSSSISRLTLLSFSAGIGLTDDAPDYSFSVSMPVRFY